MVNIRKLKAQMTLHDMSHEEVANALGMHLRTFTNRMHNPSTLRQSEMEKLSEVLQIENPTDIFFDIK